MIYGFFELVGVVGETEAFEVLGFGKYIKKEEVEEAHVSDQGGAFLLYDG